MSKRELVLLVKEETDKKMDGCENRLFWRVTILWLQECETVFRIATGEIWESSSSSSNSSIIASCEEVSPTPGEKRNKQFQWIESMNILHLSNGDKDTLSKDIQTWCHLIYVYASRYYFKTVRIFNHFIQWYEPFSDHNM